MFIEINLLILNYNYNVYVTFAGCSVTVTGQRCDVCRRNLRHIQEKYVTFTGDV